MCHSKRYLGLVVILILTLNGLAWGQGKAKEDVGQQEVLRFLKMIDRGDYAGSYALTTPYLQGMVNREKWIESLKGARRPLGKLISRQVIKSETRTSLPGAPDGFYALLKLKSSFQHKKSAIETVTLQRQKDSSLKVAGYYIR